MGKESTSDTHYDLEIREIQLRCSSAAQILDKVIFRSSHLPFVLRAKTDVPSDLWKCLLTPKLPFGVGFLLQGAIKG